MSNTSDNHKNRPDRQGEDSIYRDIVTSTNALIWRTDTEGRFTFLNPAWEKSFGYSPEEMLGKPFSEFQVPEAAEHYINVFRNCLIGESVTGHETTYFARDGEEVYLTVNMIPIYNSSGDIAGTQGTAFDMTEKRQADDLLQYISAKDELTGLYNLHTFLSMTEQQIKTAQREKKFILIIYAGIDGMESINTDYGRDRGDQVLKDTADILRKTFREADIIARPGGDEFVMSTLVASGDHDKLIKKRLDENMEAYRSEQGALTDLSISFGFALYDPAGSGSIEDSLSKSDDRMHEQKAGKKV